MLEYIDANPGKEEPRPLINSTVDKVYDFYSKHIRLPEDSTTPKPFTRFTFMVIDDECVKSDPQQCIVCCDAAEYGDLDDEVTLKMMRLPIKIAVWILTPLEQLTMTPSEALNSDSDALCSMPPFTVKQLPDSPKGLLCGFIIATPAEARVFKQRGIARRPEKSEKRIDDERGAVLFRISRREAKFVAHFHWQQEEWSREIGATMSYKAAPSRPKDE